MTRLRAPAADTLEQRLAHSLRLTGGTMPLIGADRERIESLRPHAEITRKLTGYPVRLVRFLRTDVMEELP